MDYFEGLLLGTFWSDTDFENRRHSGLFVLYGFVLCVLVLANYFTGIFDSLLSGERLVKLILCLILFLATPFLCYRYYRRPIWVRIPILLALAAKYIFMTLAMTTWVMPYTRVSFSDIQLGLINFLNKTLENATERFSESAGTFSTVLGVLTGGVYVVFLFLAVAILAILIPGTIFLLVRLAQYGYDKLIARYILPQTPDR